MHALTAWDLKFQVCLGYTFTPATLDLLLTGPCSSWSQGYKTFSSPPTVQTNNLERFFPEKSLKPILIFVSKAGAYPSAPLQGQAL
jgi:hypothetical protein